MKNIILSIILALIVSVSFGQNKSDSIMIKAYKDSTIMYLDSANKYSDIGDYYSSVKDNLNRDICYGLMIRYQQLFIKYGNLMEQIYLIEKNKIRRKFLEDKYHIKL